MSASSDPRFPAGAGAAGDGARPDVRPDAQTRSGAAAPQAGQQAVPASVRGAVDLGAMAQAGSQAAAPGAARGAGGHYLRRIATIEEFQEVAELSATVPVVLVLWAGYSEQSRTFADDLVAQVDRHEGRLVLCSVDIEQLPEIAQALQAQSVPTTVALIGGRPVPISQSTVPAEQLAPVLSELLTLAEQNGVSGTVEPTEPGGAEAEPEKPLPPLHQEAMDRLEAGDLDGAKASYEQALKENPGDTEAKLALAQVELLRRVTPMDAEAVRRAAAQDGEDLDAQLDVADLDVSGGHVEDAFQRLLQLIRRTADQDRERTRRRLIELFDVVGAEDPRVVTARGQLMRALF